MKYPCLPVSFYTLRRKKAFTLIELMIVVLIVGILSAIAMPGYSEYVRRSKAADAVSQLSSLKVKAEQFFGDRRTYTDFCATNSVAGATTASKYFSLTCTADDTSYQLTMTGIAAQNTSGYKFTVDNTNARTSQIEGNNFNCWVIKKSASCT